jgi:hypothetical protein
MSAASPLRPVIHKGALVAYALPDLVPTVIIFQYNPETVSRSLQPGGSQGGGRGDAQRVNGPPVETISLTVRLDAADQLEAPGQNRVTVDNGLHPAIAALEGLMHPAYASVIANQAMALAGSAFILGEQSPVAFLIWGERRVLPVQVAGASFREEAFSPKLDPIRVAAELSLRVLTYRDLDVTHPGYWVYLAAFTQKEVLAALNLPNPTAGPAPQPPL